MPGLTRQAVQKKFGGNKDPKHPWRQKASAVLRKIEKIPRELFTCVSCGDADCIGGDCAAKWEP